MAKDVFRLERPAEPTLRCTVWTPGERTQGTILITQGYAESIERYEHVAEAWLAGGFAVAAYDLRGQGLSEGKRGHVERFSDFTRDLNAVRNQLNATHGWSSFGPSILFGHSLGALISTVAALEQPGRFRGLGLGSPYFGLAVKPAAWRTFLGRKLTNIWPTYQDRADLNLDLLTHDASRVEMMKRDELRVKTVTARWFTEAELAQARVRAEFARLELPVFCQAAAEDHVADVEATRQVFATSSHSNHKLELVPNTYHELHQEIHRDQYLARFQSAFEQWC